MPTVSISTHEHCSVQDITDAVREAIPASHDGVVTVTSQHTTAAVTVNEAERRLLGDFADALEALVPDGGWAHDEIDDNADSHVRAMLVGASETLPVVDGDLKLGTWQSVLLVECDGPRERTVIVTPV
jgi:secondary thiamine-phosphate synthase enzyme